jgi:hypothetical protein
MGANAHEPCGPSLAASSLSGTNKTSVHHPPDRHSQHSSFAAFVIPAFVIRSIRHLQRSPFAAFAIRSVRHSRVRHSGRSSESPYLSPGSPAHPRPPSPRRSPFAAFVILGEAQNPLSVLPIEPRHTTTGNACPSTRSTARSISSTVTDRMHFFCISMHVSRPHPKHSGW